MQVARATTAHNRRPSPCTQREKGGILVGTKTGKNQGKIYLKPNIRNIIGRCLWGLAVPGAPFRGWFSARFWDGWMTVDSMFVQTIGRCLNRLLDRLVMIDTCSESTRRSDASRLAAVANGSGGSPDERTL